MKLIDYRAFELYRGTVFRFKGKYPFCEEYVDFMICDYPSVDENNCPFALYCISGYCAGHIEYVFPLEAESENSKSINKKWVIENWNKKIYNGCNVDEIELII
ncbi:MAG: Imm45 family immunity protein [Prevotella sp.]|nr:Imm45 family immunity protein [Alistipes senegalensis]MCM1357568.1 Imm45 family immunity protein [Prevotella sp.]MCM1472710.1 Imm45 family immunity protein [Muribaculaceae bacterium]